MSRDVKEIKYLDNKIYLKDNHKIKKLTLIFPIFLYDLNQNNLILTYTVRFYHIALFGLKKIVRK